VAVIFKAKGKVKQDTLILDKHNRLRHPDPPIEERKKASSPPAPPPEDEGEKNLRLWFMGSKILSRLTNKGFF
jgi:hypothetical protein